MNGAKVSKFLSWFLVCLICFPGFIIQVGHVTERHFEYQTRTVVELTIPNDIMMPFVSACFRINDVMKFDTVRQIYNRTGIKHWSTGIYWNGFYHDTADFTVKEWFDFTPSTDEVLRNIRPACRVRIPKRFVPFEFKKIDCFKQSNIVKYFDREFVCYRYEPKFTNQTLSLTEYTMAPGSTGIIYDIYFNASFIHNYQYVSLSVQSNDSSYLYNTVFASSHKLSGYHHFKLDVHYQEVERVRMREPYDTRCVKIPGNYTTGAEYRLAQINYETMERMDKVIPFVATSNGSLQQKLFSILDFRNQTIVTQLNQMIDSRKELKECKTKYFITKAKPANDDTFAITLYWPQNDKVKVRYVPQSEAIDYVVYIGSCVGMWFGLSALSIVDGVQFIGRSFKHKVLDGAPKEEETKKLNEKKLKRLEKEINSLKVDVAFLKRFKR